MQANLPDGEHLLPKPVGDVFQLKFTAAVEDGCHCHRKGLHHPHKFILLIMQLPPPKFIPTKHLAYLTLQKRKLKQTRQTFQLVSSATSTNLWHKLGPVVIMTSHRIFGWINCVDRCANFKLDAPFLHQKIVIYVRATNKCSREWRKRNNMLIFDEVFVLCGGAQLHFPTNKQEYRYRVVVGLGVACRQTHFSTYFNNFGRSNRKLRWHDTQFSLESDPLFLGDIFSGEKICYWRLKAALLSRFYDIFTAINFKCNKFEFLPHYTKELSFL